MTKRRPRGETPKGTRKTVRFTDALLAEAEADATRRGVSFGTAIHQALAEHYKLAPRACSKPKIHVLGEWMAGLDPKVAGHSATMSDHYTQATSPEARRAILTLG